MASAVIPIFPLQLIAFPGEEVALHIFEPRYRELVAYCSDNKVSFGLVPVFGKKIAQVGILMQITQIAHRYDDGRMDIRTRAGAPFKLLKIHAVPDHSTYHTADVEAIALQNTHEQALRLLVEHLYQEFHRLIQTVRIPQIAQHELLSYQIGHTSGLDNEGQLELLVTTSEQKRLLYLKDHLEAVLPTLRGIELTRNKVRQNGHFRILPPEEGSDLT